MAAALAPNEDHGPALFHAVAGLEFLGPGGVAVRVHDFHLEPGAVDLKLPEQGLDIHEQRVGGGEKDDGGDRLVQRLQHLDRARVQPVVLRPTDVHAAMVPEGQVVDHEPDQASQRQAGEGVETNGHLAGAGAPHARGRGAGGRLRVHFHRRASTTRTAVNNTRSRVER